MPSSHGKEVTSGRSSPSVVTSVPAKPMRVNEEITFVVINGNPGIIVGVDEGIWVSAKKEILVSQGEFFVMSEPIFKFLILV